MKQWETLPEEIFKNASVAKDLAQETQNWGEAKDKEEKEACIESYCPCCRLDSHTEVQCLASVRKKNFKRFKHDLAQVVIEGKLTDDLQYVMGTDDNSDLYACHLLSAFGDFAEGHSSEGHRMAGNAEVMELWARFSGEGMSKMAAEEHLKMAY